MKLLFLDVETTGLDPEKHGIWQLCYQYGLLSGTELLLDEPVEVRMRPHPKVDIDPRALAISNITLKDLGSYMPEVEHFKDFLRFLDSKVDKYNKKDKVVLVAYNAEFDTKFLRRWFELNNERYFGSRFWHPSYCVMYGAMTQMMAVRQDLEDFKQGTVARAMGVDVDESKLHDAKYDVHIMVELFKRLLTWRVETEEKEEKKSWKK